MVVCLRGWKWWLTPQSCQAQALSGTVQAVVGVKRVQELAGAVHQHTLGAIAIGVSDQVTTKGLALAISQDRPAWRKGKERQK
jgi:hypothetical protein